MSIDADEENLLIQVKGQNNVDVSWNMKILVLGITD